MGKGREIQRGQSGEMEGEKQWGQETWGKMERERGERQTRQGRGRKSPQLCRVGTARAETKREEDLGN